MRIPLVTRNALTLLVPTLLLLGAAALPALADDVHLTNGGMLEGKARRIGDKVVVETQNGTVELRVSEVKSIVVGKTRHDRYVLRRDRLIAEAKGAPGES